MRRESRQCSVCARNYGIDMKSADRDLSYSSYQNGGLKSMETDLPRNPEPSGWEKLQSGIHGRNGLMGNSLLDVIVFGRNAGKEQLQGYKR